MVCAKISCFSLKISRFWSDYFELMTKTDFMERILVFSINSKNDRIENKNINQLVSFLAN